MAHENEHEKRVRKVPVIFERKYTLERKVCKGCGEPYEGTRVSLYCTPECRQRAAWRRNGPAYLERKQQREKDHNAEKGQGQ